MCSSDLAHALCGHIRGGLGHVNVIGSMVFAGMSGSAAADAAGLGRVEIKAMVEGGYRPEFAAAISATSSVIGPIIPPSIGLVLYPDTTNFGLPTWATRDAARTDLQGAWKLFTDTRTPVPVHPGFVLATCVAIWLVAFLADWIGRAHV